MGSGFRKVSFPAIWAALVVATDSAPVLRLYYEFRTDRLPVLTSPIHHLLHLYDCIVRQGPPSYYWCFGLERFGGWLKQNVRNRRDAITALSNIVIYQEKVTHMRRTALYYVCTH